MLSEILNLRGERRNVEDRAIYFESRDKRTLQSQLSIFGLRHASCIITAKGSYYKHYECFTHPDGEGCEIERFKSKRGW